MEMKGDGDGEGGRWKGRGWGGGVGVRLWGAAWDLKRKEEVVSEEVETMFLFREISDGFDSNNQPHISPILQTHSPQPTAHNNPHQNPSTLISIPYYHYNNYTTNLAPTPPSPLYLSTLPSITHL